MLPADFVAASGDEVQHRVFRRQRLVSAMTGAADRLTSRFPADNPCPRAAGGVLRAALFLDHHHELSGTRHAGRARRRIHAGELRFVDRRRLHPEEAGRNHASWRRCDGDLPGTRLSGRLPPGPHAQPMERSSLHVHPRPAARRPRGPHLRLDDHPVERRRRQPDDDLAGVDRRPDAAS